MNAVAGFFSRDKAPARAIQVERMVSHLTGSNSGAEESWHHGPAAFGGLALNRRADQLYVSPGQQLAIIADARIDNRSEIEGALTPPAPRLGVMNDSQLILETYERWGQGGIGRLVGDFAFAIWDGRRNQLVCARDAFGVRPFYYACYGRELVFASEIRALLSLPEVPRRLNEDRLADYLANHVEENGDSLFAGICVLPGGHMLVIDEEAIRIRRFWTPEPADLRLRSEADYAETFRALLVEAVRCRIPISGVVGSTLSGGLDSSSVVCVARDLLAERGQAVDTFSAVYDRHRECDERVFIQAVVAAGGVRSHEVSPEGLSPLAAWPGRSPCDDEPAWNPQVAILRAVYEAARDADINVVLEGFGGDDIVSHGAAYVSELIGRGRWIRALKEARALSANTGYPLRPILQRRALAAFAPTWAIGAWRRIHDRSDGAAFGMPVTPRFSRRGRLKERVAWARDRYHPPRTVMDEHRRDLAPTLWGPPLRVATRVARLHGIDVRYPLMDRRLAEFCLSMPGNHKLSGGWSRMIMRRALVGVLPEDVRWRRDKANYSASFRTGLREKDASLVSHVLAQPGQLAEFVDMPRLVEVWRRFLEAGSDGDAMTIWRAVTLACWLESAFGSAQGVEERSSGTLAQVG